MFYNVSQLLMEPIGSVRQFELDQPLSGVLEDIPAGQARGRLRLLRTHQGLLVEATVDVEVVSTCDRCLADFVNITRISLEEDCYPTIDPATGRRMNPPDLSEGVLHVDSSQTLDFSDVFRQYILTCEPLKALCREDCLGLCPECGADLNTGSCQCEGISIDPRWGALANLLSRDSN